MARTVIKMNYTNADGLMNRISNVLTTSGYKNINENNENVWKCGVGFWTAMKYIKIEFAQENTLIVSGWIRSVGGNDQDLNGFVGALPKKQVMNIIKQIQSLVW